MDLQNALNELGNRLGVGGIELDSRSGCQLAFDNDLVVDIDIVEGVPGFYVTSAVGEMAGGNRELVFTEVLEANLHGRGTGQCFFAFDSDLDELILSRYIDRDEIDVELLEVEIESFLQTLEFWKSRFQEGRVGTLAQNHKADVVSPIDASNMLRP